MKSQEDTIVVMVVYRPPASVHAAIEALLPQVKALVVVDNGQNAALKQAMGDRVIWLQSSENNLGIAQNLGIAKARELGAEFVLLMDDDSLPAPDMVQHLRGSWTLGVAVVAPNLQEPSGRAPHYIQATGKGWFRRITFTQPLLNRLFYVAASGSLIPLCVIDAIGAMDEDFGIYFIDTEFCLRARKAGYDIVAVEAAKMQHRFGNVTSHFVCGKEITTTNHPPESRRLMYRNRKRLWFAYLFTDTGYVLFDTLRCWSEIARILLFEDLKMSKMLAILRGLLFSSH
jgi:GT2 family glycosyltransferase